MEKHFKILFLCTGNSARSIFAEYLIRRINPGFFESFSAGSTPKASPHPLAIKVLADHYHLDTSEARSKSWDEFAGVDFDFIITLCDDAKETCPVWPGRPIIAHWGSPDPATFEGTDEEKEKFFWQVAQQINRRLELLASLPFEKLDAFRLQSAMSDIGTREQI